jgi:Flp pilus assembly protein TadG
MMNVRNLFWSVQNFGRDQDGSPAMEFAFAAPLFFLMVMATIEFGLVMFVTVLMESSLRDASRYGVTGQLPNGASTMAEREEHIRQMIADRTLSLVNMDDAVVDIFSYPTFDDIGQGEDFVDGNGNGTYDSGETFKDCNGNGTRDDDRGEEGPGGSGSVVLYRMTYDWPLLTPLVGPIIGSDGKFPLRATLAVRNEPWNLPQDGSTPQACNL